MDLMLALVLGDQRQAREMLRRFHAAHVPIHGVLGSEAGKFESGTPYNAADPALRLWVLATLIDTTLLAYERFVAPLAPGDRTRFYADSLASRRNTLSAGNSGASGAAGFHTRVSGALFHGICPSTIVASPLATRHLRPDAQ
jgi:hypothetical protein